MAMLSVQASMQVAIKRACAHPTAKQVVLTQHADTVMDALIRLQSSRDAISDEAIMTMSVLCLEQGSDFVKYLQPIMPFLLTGLGRHEDVQVCRICINAVGDIAREVGDGIAPFADKCVPLTNNVF
jgi:hypothetical protein